MRKFMAKNPPRAFAFSLAGVLFYALGLCLLLATNAWSEDKAPYATQPIKIALLLPLTAKDETIRLVARDLYHAAQLALFDYNNPHIKLLVKDTKATPEGSQSAALKAINDGAQFLIGPLLGKTTKAAAAIAKQGNVPLLSFSTDSQVAEDGVYLFGHLYENNLTRIIKESSSQGLKRFVVLLPQNLYGEKILSSLRATVAEYGGQLVRTTFYDPNSQDYRKAVKDLTYYEERRLAMKNEKQRLMHENSQRAFDTLKNYEKRNIETFGSVPFDAILLAEGGTTLKSIAPLLSYFELSLHEVQLLGTGLWDNTDLDKEPSLLGGWYAAPPHENWNIFQKKFTAIYKNKPIRLSSLGYDSVSLAINLLSSTQEWQGSWKKMLTNPQGFWGIDGLVRLTPNGLNQRGLAVFQVTKKGSALVAPAPGSFFESQ